MKENYLTKKSTRTSCDVIKKTTTLFNVAIVLFLFLFNTTYAQSNDCATSGAAGQLTVGTSCTAVAFNSTNNTNYWNGATGCNASDDDDAWGWFDAIATSTTITYTPTTRDAVLHLFTGSCSTGMTALACADANGAGIAETITYATTIGVRYLIRIQRYNSSANMDGTICVYSPLPPCTTPTAQPTALTFNTLTSTSLNGAFTAASPAPSGYLVVRSTSATPPTPVNGTTYAVGSTALGAGTLVIQGSAVTSNAVSFASNTLTSNTRYYYHIFSYNTSCIGTPFYLTTSPLTNNAITCPATPTAPVNSAITGSGFTVTWTASAVGGGAATISYILEVYTDAGYTSPITGSPFAVGTPVTYALTGLNASTTYYYRIKANNTSCDSGYLNGSAATSCATPAAQPTSLTFNTLTSTSLNGAFTAASPAPSGYLVVRSTSATPPTPVNGTTYAVGSTALGAGTLVIQGSAVTSNAVSFASNTLTSNTRYYYHIFSYNASCTGTPFYLTTAPLTNNAITCPATPTAPVNSAITGSGFTVTWTASAVGGGAATISYILEVYTDAGYTSPITGSPFAVGTPVTYALTGLNASTTYYYRIKANNTSCDSGYLNGSAATLCATPTAQPTSLTFNTLTSTSLNGAFTAASPAPSGYLVVRSTSATPPTPVNGTTYAVGSTALGAGTLVIQGSAVTSNAVSFASNTLTSNTRYYYHIFSYNASCTGTPFYLTTAPLTNNAITCPAAPTAPVNSAITGSGFTVTWTASAVGGGAATISYILEVYTDAGYTSPITGSPFAVGTPVSYAVTGLNATTTYYYRIKANNTSCDSGYVTGTVTTLIQNDDCSGAIPLTVSTTCSYSNYTNAGATGSTGITAPGCASYNGGDVWFSAVVPATGELDINLQAGVMTDSGIAFYSGTCGALTLLDCDDDSGAGNMSYIAMTGLTPGQTIYIRVWEYGNDNNGTFGICATTPSCPSPSDLFANILSTTSVTVNWTASTPPAAGGYQYYINTTGTVPTAGTTPTGSTAPGVIGVTFTGLTPGQKYYFWVRSFCGGTDTSTWFGPTNYTPCAVGNGTGTTTLGCTSPIAGGLGLSGTDPAALSCSALTCPTLEVSYLPIKQTTDYTVTAITYAPPYQYTCLQNPVSVNVDDIWSPTINLPFNFCFYGNNYNKCLIGSNGVITFDTTSNTPGGYSTWSFNTNLPDTNLFKNTIFGVYHDIDPSKGGQVGWELITLNTGCRALVASWNDIPMYSSSCNSSYYTGMMVLYENTNVIEVYIEEKNVCSTWNNGNGIVGVQNSTGTSAVVAPGRNGLDTNWAVTNEAWRFTPNGPTINPTVQWYQGSVATGTPISGATSSTVTVCPTVSTSYTAEVTYPLCTGNLKVTDQVAVTVTGNKIWNGSTSSDWNTNSNWTPSGVPTSANCVVIPVVNSPRPYPILSNTPNGVGYNLAIYSNASLTVGANQNLTITDKITVQSPSTGAFTVNNNANLLQINDTAVNTGSIFYKRIAPSIKGSDYVYWSSPVLSQNIGTFYDSGITSGVKYRWNTTVNNGNGASGNIGQGNWEAASGIMTPGKGYIVRGSSSFGMPATNIGTTFTGTPNNGIIPYSVLRGSYTGPPYNGANTIQITNLNDNYNLLGNPYPSSMNILKFLQLNAYHAIDNPSGQILGNVRLWTHGTDPLIGVANPFYGSFLYNYDVNDYILINYMGSTTPGAPDIIKSGQAFFVQMTDGVAGSGTVNFNNSMRFDSSNLPYSNGNFFKNGNSTNDNEIPSERHRIWLDLVDANSHSSRILLGYATNATNNYDTLYDAPSAIPAGMKLFSMIENENDVVYDIQGRALPFDVNDEISIGIKAPTEGNYTFAIATLDGLFTSQNIYLKDNLLNITHDLKTNPYHFTSQAGVINNRFKVVYINNALGTNNPNEINTFATISNNTILVESNEFIKAIDLYEISGKLINSYSLTEIKKQFSDVFNYPNGVYIAKITFDNDMVVSKKLIH